MQVTLADDTTQPVVEFEDPTPEHNAYQTQRYVNINISIEEGNLDELVYNWDEANYTIYNESLVLMYNFDNVSALGESNTKVVDLSGNGNNGTVNGDGDEINTTGAAKYGAGGLNLDGNDYIDLGSPDTLDTLGQGSYSLEAWIKTSNTDTRQAIIGNYDGTPAYVLELHVTGNVRMYVKNTGYNSAFNVDDGQWHHIVGVRDLNTNILMYVDGKEIYNYGSDPEGAFTVSHNTMIGRNPSGGYALHMTGDIDEVRIWNRSLSGDEIYQQYVSNLNKYNTTQWYLYVNQSKNATDILDDGIYTYQAFAQDKGNLQSASEQRTIYINVDPTPPVPEASTILLMSIGIISLLSLIIIKKKQDER